MNQRLTLLELNTKIRNALQDAFPATVWVVAEISEMKEHRTGHCYLDLVEKDEFSDEIKARARATIWSYSWRMIKPYFETTTGQPFTEGIKVLVQASVEFHPSYGLSLNIRDIDPTYTIGDLVRRRREIVKQLVEAGVMHMNKELPLPLVPQRIAIISSASAAGYQDFVEHLDNNPEGFRFYYRLFEAYMQGTEAVPAILRALDQIYSHEDEFDAVAIIRGGGASVDLSCFDNFDLAYTVAQFPLPVITGIGHEKDDTIVDLVAHTRLKTPTAAAGFFISGASAFMKLLLEKEQRVTNVVRELLDDELEKVSGLAETFSTTVKTYINAAAQDLRKTTQRIHRASTRFTYAQREALSNIKHRVNNTVLNLIGKQANQLQNILYRSKLLVSLQFEKQRHILAERRQRMSRSVGNIISSNNQLLNGYNEKIRLLDPAVILKRGFTITRQQNKIITSPAQLSDNIPIETQFSDGIVTSKIIKKE